MLGDLVCRTAERSREVTVVKFTQSVPRADGAERRAETAEPGQRRFQGDGRITEMAAAAALAPPGRRGAHCPRAVQKPTKTWVESTNPSRMLTITPAVKA